MASPPYAASPSAMSPPYPSPIQITSKKRTSTMDVNMPPGKRRKSSVVSQPPIHPLRQTSFPPEAGSGSPYPRSPSVDATSHVSGSVVSATAGRKKRGRRTKNAKGGGDDSTEKTPSLVGGKAPTAASGQGGDKELEEDEDDDKAEMALEDAVARTQEQKQEEIRLRAMLVEAFDPLQYDRYEFWRAAKLSDAVVKRVSEEEETKQNEVMDDELTRLGCQCNRLTIGAADGGHGRQGSGQALCRRDHRGCKKRPGRMGFVRREAE